MWGYTFSLFSFFLNICGDILVVLHTWTSIMLDKICVFNVGGTRKHPRSILHKQLKPISVKLKQGYLWSAIWITIGSARQPMP